jgi:hypothetical protein
MSGAIAAVVAGSNCVHRLHRRAARKVSSGSDAPLTPRWVTRDSFHSKDGESDRA